ncbi:peptidase M14 [candidate division KSB1 bacterium]|nr:peptidase M14 [candidate division KSB1 bacterium]
MKRLMLPTMLLLLTLVLFPKHLFAEDRDEKLNIETPLIYINTHFENGSPLYWQVESDGTILVSLVYDHERGALNRACIHWFFQVYAKAGSDLTLVLQNFNNIWNGRMDLSDATEKTTCYISEDGQNWTYLPTKKISNQKLEVKIHMNSDSLFVARLEPYRVCDLEKLKAEITDHPLVKITRIGTTVEKRPLEIIRIGHANAPFRIFLRGRAHAWEPGGNWVIQGLIRSLLADDGKSRSYLDKYCVYILPMANKDRVFNGGTRFNMQGMDLNRKWDKPADPALSPENAALERWLNEMIKLGLKPDLAIDFHNDSDGKLHISRPNINLETYLKNMRRFEDLLSQYTWFREGSTGSDFRNPGSFGEGLLERFGIDACILELNANWIQGLSKVPYGKDWELLGEQLRAVFYEYFSDNQ